VPLLTARAAAVTRPGGTSRVAGLRHGPGAPHFRVARPLIGVDRPRTTPPTPVFVLLGGVFEHFAPSRRLLSVDGHVASVDGHVRRLIDAPYPLMDTPGAPGARFGR